MLKNGIITLVNSSNIVFRTDLPVRSSWWQCTNTSLHLDVGECGYFRFEVGNDKIGDLAISIPERNGIAIDHFVSSQGKLSLSWLLDGKTTPHYDFIKTEDARVKLSGNKNIGRMFFLRRQCRSGMKENALLLF